MGAAADTMWQLYLEYCNKPVLFTPKTQTQCELWALFWFITFTGSSSGPEIYLFNFKEHTQSGVAERTERVFPPDSTSLLFNHWILTIYIPLKNTVPLTESIRGTLSPFCGEHRTALCCPKVFLYSLLLVAKVLCSQAETKDKDALRDMCTFFLSHWNENQAEFCWEKGKLCCALHGTVLLLSTISDLSSALK